MSTTEKLIHLNKTTKIEKYSKFNLHNYRREGGIGSNSLSQSQPICLSSLVTFACTQGHGMLMDIMDTTSITCTQHIPQLNTMADP